MGYRSKVILPVVGMLVIFGCATAAVVREARGESKPPHAAGVATPSPMVAFNGGLFEASGVAHVPGTDGVLFVDDGRPDEIFWMRLGDGRKQSGAIRAVRLGASVVDLEGITT